MSKSEGKHLKNAPYFTAKKEDNLILVIIFKTLYDNSISVDGM
jgi:hypothetical protein